MDKKDYIEREVVLDLLNWYEDYELIKIRNKVWDISAADVAPVVHGKWAKIEGMAPPEYHGKHKCSVCGCRALERKMHEVLSDYCPNCGARMDGGNENG